MTPTDEQVERACKALALCITCDGDGTVADGLDEAAVSIECPTCFGCGYDLRPALSTAGMGWQDIATAPRDGTWILACGRAYPELIERGHWILADTDKKRVPHTMMIKWIEAFYDKEIDNGDGTYRKERTEGYAYWWPEPHAFIPDFWMPLPPPPSFEPEARSGGDSTATRVNPCPHKNRVQVRPGKERCLDCRTIIYASQEDYWND